MTNAITTATTDAGERGATMHVTLRGVKTWNSRDGGGYQATLCADGAPFAQCTQDGHGGPLQWSVSDVALFTAWATSHGVADALLPNGVVRCDTEIDLAAERLMDAHEEAQQVRKWCKSKTVFVLPGDQPGAYRTLGAPFSAAVRAQVLAKYPNAIILNERTTL